MPALDSSSASAETPASVEQFRVEYRAKEIGPRYSGWGHFTFTSVGSLSIIAFALWSLEAVHWYELLIVPAGFLFANFAEYKGHRGPMHHKTTWARILFERHTLQHHHFFTHEAMSYASSRDFKMVLFPPVMLFFFLGVIATPVAVVLFLVSTANIGWLYVAVAMGYFLTYEWLHFAYHLPPDTVVGKLPFVARLRHHHMTHHDLALMGKWNFNITFPICDRLFGTHHGAAMSQREAAKHSKT